MTDTKLAPGDAAPDFTLPAADGGERLPRLLPRQAGDPLFLPRRDDPWLHQAGL